MNKYFVTYEQALALKELGFHEPCLAWFGSMLVLSLEKKVKNRSGDSKTNKKWDGCTNIPLYSQAFEWFRVNHNLFCTINVNQTMEPKFCYSIAEYFDNFEWETLVFNSDLYYEYQQAESACLDELIKITKSWYT